MNLHVLLRRVGDQHAGPASCIAWAGFLGPGPLDSLGAHWGWLSGEGECPGTSQACVAPSSPAVCQSGWGELSAALNHPGMGRLTFPSDKAPRLIVRVSGPWEQIPGKRAFPDSWLWLWIPGCPPSPSSAPHTLSPPHQGARRANGEQLLYDEINSVSLSKHLMGVSDVAG